MNGLETMTASGYLFLCSSLIASLCGCSNHHETPASPPVKTSGLTASTQPADSITLKLPDPASKLHPDYSFKPIDKTWGVEESALDPGTNYFSIIKPSERKPGKRYYRELRFFASLSLEPRKIVCFDPDGNICQEIDRNISAADSRKGTQHDRSFRPDGSISGYEYWKDGRHIDILHVNKDGRIEKLEDGRGLLHGTLLDGTARHMWYFGGLELLENWFKEGKLVRAQLNLAHDDILVIYNSGSEELSFDGEHWDRPDGKSVRKFVKEAGNFRWPGELGTPSPEQTAQEAKRYVERRRQFLKAFATQVTKAGYKIDELGLDSLIPDLKAIAAELATQPVSAPTPTSARNR